MTVWLNLCTCKDDIKSSFDRNAKYLKSIKEGYLKKLGLILKEKRGVLWALIISSVQNVDLKIH